jgi:hypothetical protein
MNVIVDLSEAVDINVPAAPKEMISVTKEGNKTKVRINSSSLSVIQECPRKAKYNFVEGWRPLNESPATLYGRAIHAALEVFYSSHPDTRDIPALEQMELMAFGHVVPDQTTSVCLKAAQSFLEIAAPLSALPETDKRSPLTGMYTLWHYFKSFAQDPYITYSDADGYFVERKFSFILHEDSDLIIEYFGTVDLVLQHVLTQELFVTDHKTSSVVGVDFYNRLKPNHQYTGYLMGARKAFGIQTNSFLVNCLQVKERPKTSRGQPPHFPRQVTTRDEDDYREFTESVVKFSRDWVKMLGDNVFPMGHVNACATYGGCSYLPVCSSPDSMRQTILNGKFNKGSN